MKTGAGRTAPSRSRLGNGIKPSRDREGAVCVVAAGGSGPGMPGPYMTRLVGATHASPEGNGPARRIVDTNRALTDAALRDEFRRAVSAGLYPKAEALIAEYCRGLDSGPALREAADLIEWARRTTLAARAAAAAQLASLPANVPRYRANEPARHTWEMLG